MTDGQPRAAVDVGTNSVRLLVVDAAGQRLDRQLTITRLGQGVDATGRLHPDALRRTIETIDGYARTWTEHGVGDAVRIAATSAVRDAANRDEFFAAVRRVAGVDAEVLSGEDEAALAFAGAVGAVEVDHPTAVVDLGGGSTELVVGDADGQVVAAVSLQLGCVRLTERFLHGDPPSLDELRAAETAIATRLDEADAALGERGASLHEVASLIGVAGTSTTLAALHLGLDAYREEAIHGTRVPVEHLLALSADLAARTAADRAQLGPVQAGREDVIHGGALILAAIVSRYGLPELVVSEADGLDGLVASLAG